MSSSETDEPYCSTEIYIGTSTTLTAVGCWTTNATYIYDLDSSIAIPSNTLIWSPVNSPTPSFPLTPFDTPTPTPHGSPNSPSGTTPTPPPDQIFPTQSPTITPGSDDLSDGAIAGIAIGAIFALAIIALLAFFLWKKQSRSAHPGMVPVEVTQYQPPQVAPYQQYPPQHQTIFPDQPMVNPVIYRNDYLNQPKPLYSQSPPPPQEQGRDSFGIRAAEMLS